MKRTALFFSILLVAGTIHAQDIFKKHGYNKETLTLSKGRYKETFINEGVIQIGTVLIDTRTDKVVKFLEDDDTESGYKAELSSRFLTVDPLAEKYPWLSPYVYCNNNPVRYVDTDGRSPISFLRGIHNAYKLQRAATAVRAATAADAALVTGVGVATTGYTYNHYLSPESAAKAQQSLLKGISDMVNQNAAVSPEYNNQRKREGDAKDRRNQEQANVAKGIDTNITGTMPDGSPSPKRDPNDGGNKTKIAIGISVIGIGSAAVKSIVEGMKPQKIEIPQEPVKQPEIKPQEIRNGDWWQRELQYNNWWQGEFQYYGR